MSIADQKNTTDPNSLLYYAPRRLRDRAEAIRAIQLQQRENEPPVPLVPTATLPFPEGSAPVQRAPGQRPQAKPLPEALLEPLAPIESLQVLSQRARRRETVALTMRFVALTVVAASIAFVYVAFFTRPHDQLLAGKEAPGAADEATPRSDKLTIDPAALKAIPVKVVSANGEPMAVPPPPAAADQAQNAATFPPLAGDIKMTMPAAGTETKAAVADPDTRQIDPKELAALIKRGEELTSGGDIPAARLLLQRAAEARDARAAFDLAATYDPNIIKQFGNNGARPDPALAKTWYQRARDWGSPDAPRQLDALARIER